MKHAVLRNAWKSLIGATKYKDNAEVKQLLGEMVKKLDIDLVNDKDLKGNGALGILLSSDWVSKKRTPITLDKLFNELTERFDWKITKEEFDVQIIDQYRAIG